MEHTNTNKSCHQHSNCGYCQLVYSDIVTSVFLFGYFLKAGYAFAVYGNNNNFHYHVPLERHDKVCVVVALTINDIWNLGSRV